MPRRAERGDLEVCVELVLAMLPLVEELASDARVAAVRNRVQMFFDERSRPLRDAVSAWARARRIHFYCTRWCGDTRRWRFESSDLVVEVDEAGSRAWVGEISFLVSTPRALRARLAKLYPKPDA